MRTGGHRWRRRLLALGVLVLAGGLGFGAYAVDRMALGYLTGMRRMPGRDMTGAAIRQDGPVPGFAFLGRTAPSDDPPGLRVLRPFDAAREIGLRAGDVILSVDGKTYRDGGRLLRDLVETRRAGETVVLRVASPGEPPREVRLVLRPLLRHPGDLGLPYEDVEIVSASGLHLRGWYIPPPPWGDGRAGVFVHGAWSSRHQALEHGAEHWYRRGYGLLAMDLSGRGASEGDYVTFTVNERKDVVAMVRWLSERPELRRDALVVFGTSNGAAAAIYAAAEEPAIAALALDAPYSDLYAAAAEMLAARGAPTWLRAPLALAVRLRAGIDIASVRPIDVVTAIEAPVLFIHGDADRLVPPYHSERMAAARRAAGLPTERWVLPGGEHGFDDYPPPGIFWNRVLDFFDTALGGPPPALDLGGGAERPSGP